MMGCYLARWRGKWLGVWIQLCGCMVVPALGWPGPQATTLVQIVCTTDVALWAVVGHAAWRLQHCAAAEVLLAWHAARRSSRQRPAFPHLTPSRMCCAGRAGRAAGGLAFACPPCLPMSQHLLSHHWQPCMVMVGQQGTGRCVVQQLELLWDHALIPLPQRQRAAPSQCKCNTDSYQVAVVALSAPAGVCAAGAAAHGSWLGSFDVTGCGGVLVQAAFMVVCAPTMARMSQAVQQHALPMPTSVCKHVCNQLSWQCCCTMLMMLYVVCAAAHLQAGHSGRGCPETPALQPGGWEQYVLASSAAVQARCAGAAAGQSVRCCKCVICTCLAPSVQEASKTPAPGVVAPPGGGGGASSVPGTAGTGLYVAPCV
jgi:hypothetical protein